MKIGGEKHPLWDACSSMFMRVRRTVPQFTFGFSERFVNRISLVSTGFFWFLPILFGFWFIFGYFLGEFGKTEPRLAPMPAILKAMGDHGLARRCADFNG
jgi:hypothetical protein